MFFHCWSQSLQTARALSPDGGALSPDGGSLFIDGPSLFIDGGALSPLGGASSYDSISPLLEVTGLVINADPQSGI